MVSHPLYTAFAGRSSHLENLLSRWVSYGNLHSLIIYKQSEVLVPEEEIITRPCRCNIPKWLETVAAKEVALGWLETAPKKLEGSGHDCQGFAFG